MSQGAQGKIVSSQKYNTNKDLKSTTSAMLIQQQSQNNMVSIPKKNQEVSMSHNQKQMLFVKKNAKN
jgi:hypothetical protein